MKNESKRNNLPRCPYCVSGAEFSPMKVLSNGRQICENCGHIVFPDNRVFWCPCQRCTETRLSPTVRGLMNRG